MASSHDLAVAFGVTAAAGMATLVGGMVVFVPQLYSPKVLAACLALAAGVMVYVSFVEIFFKGKPYWREREGVWGRRGKREGKKRKGEGEGGRIRVSIISISN